MHAERGPARRIPAIVDMSRLEASASAGPKPKGREGASFDEVCRYLPELTGHDLICPARVTVVM